MSSHACHEKPSPFRRRSDHSTILPRLWAPTMVSERLKKLDDRLLVAPLQFFKFLNNVSSLAAVPPDCVEKGQRPAVVHQSWPQADSPQRRRADLVSAALEILFREIPGHLLQDFPSVVLGRSLQD